jgi:hypothetical protein
LAEGVAAECWWRQVAMVAAVFLAGLLFYLPSICSFIVIYVIAGVFEGSIAGALGFS